MSGHSPEGDFAHCKACTVFLVNKQKIPHGKVNIITTQINTQHQMMLLCGLMGIPVLKLLGVFGQTSVLQTEEVKHG